MHCGGRCATDSRLARSRRQVAGETLDYSEAAAIAYAEEAGARAHQ
jgi:hypothetical protein